MKHIGKLIIFIFTFLSLAMSSFAESPRDQLQIMVEQLQKAPDDSALREKIIKLAPTMKPAPDLPEAAITYEGRARFAFGHAKSEDDYLAAAKEYEKAVAAAPWVPNLYSDLCLAYEKAGKFEEAKNNCGYYLIGLTDPAEITDVKGRIAGLEFGIEKANSPQKEKATQSAGPDFSGCWQDPDYVGSQKCSFVFERNGGSWIVRDEKGIPQSMVKSQGRQLWFEGDRMGWGWTTTHWELVLSEDGKTIDLATEETQSTEQFNRMKRARPNMRLDLGRDLHYTLRRK